MADPNRERFIEDGDWLEIQEPEGDEQPASDEGDDDET